MLWLSGKLDQFEAMSASSLKIVEPHDLPNTILRYLDLYQDLV
jgi:hypothetical protein